MNCLRDSPDILRCSFHDSGPPSMPRQAPVFLHIPQFALSGCIPSLLNVTSLTAGTFIVYSYKYQHDDGRISYPLCFIFSSPQGESGRLASLCTCAACLCLTWLFACRLQAGAADDVRRQQKQTGSHRPADQGP